MLKALRNGSAELKQYFLITANYWAFTLTDGALRMLVVLFFYELGYTPIAIAMLFVFYELFGMLTNLLGGWLGSRIGLNKTMNIGLALQIIALSMLLIEPGDLTPLWVMGAQALSGVAKDLNKMSAKSAIKLLVPENADGTLFKWVAILTGSKNTLKGAGFFLGGALLVTFGFRSAIAALVAGLAAVWLVSLIFLKQDLGKSHAKIKITSILSKSAAINRLSAARLFLFAARDVWFVVALPVYLASQFDWSHAQVGSFMASWIIAYGFVQTSAPNLIRRFSSDRANSAFVWVSTLAIATLLMAAGGSVLSYTPSLLIGGLLGFGAIFAVNSSLHSFLIVHFADRGAVSVDVGFYYMANAAGRLLGTVLSGAVYQQYGMAACLWVASALLGLAAVISLRLPPRQR